MRPPLSTLLSLRYKTSSPPTFRLCPHGSLKAELSGLAPFSQQPTQSLPNDRFLLLCLLCVQTAGKKCAWAGIERRGWAERSVGGGVQRYTSSPKSQISSPELPLLLSPPTVPLFPVITNVPTVQMPLFTFSMLAIIMSRITKCQNLHFAISSAFRRYTHFPWMSAALFMASWYHAVVWWLWDTSETRGIFMWVLDSVDILRTNLQSIIHDFQSLESVDVTAFLMISAPRNASSSSSSSVKDR